MWPILLDMTKEESLQHLRSLEIDAFSTLVSALRAQGSLDHEKLKLIKDTGSILHISQERHKAEIRRVVNDEKLNTIAYHVNGEKHSSEEWAEEGQRLIPLMPRIAPQTAYSAIADEVADTASKLNKQLPSPACTERKRPPPISPTHSIASTSEQCTKNLQFRMLEPELKKRRLSLNMENSNLAQHLMGPPKINKIQQIYRQKTKARQKEQQILKMKSQEMEKCDFVNVQQIPLPHLISQSSKVHPKLNINQISSLPQNSPKINILQNISLQVPPGGDEQKPEVTTESTDLKEGSPLSASSLENPLHKVMNKVISGPLNKVTIMNDIQKTIKVSAPRKTISKTVTTSSGQKLIVVSTPQTLTTSSILQRTLTTLPLKNISMKNLDKFKIVTTTCSSTASTLSNPIQIQNSKQKVVTVRTTANKKMIPFSQVQVLNTKGEIKVLPLGGKIIPKGNTNITPNYYINAMPSSEIAKSINSTPVLMCPQPQINSLCKILPEALGTPESIAPKFENESIESDKLNVECVSQNLKVEQSEDLSDDLETTEIFENVECENVTGTDAIKLEDNENEVTQITEVTNEIQMDHPILLEQENGRLNNVQMDTSIKQEQTDIIIQDETLNNKINSDLNSYCVVDEVANTNKNLLLEDLQIDGNLDPITGQYSITENMDVKVESQILTTETSEVEINQLN